MIPRSRSRTNEGVDTHTKHYVYESSETLKFADSRHVYTHTYTHAWRLTMLANNENKKIGAKLNKPTHDEELVD